MPRPLIALIAVLLALPTALATPPSARETAVFAGGCFWGIEGVYEHVRGVESATSGYTGGSVASPTYRQVSSGRTGHAEAVRVVFDPAQVSYAQLLSIFFQVAHDPTQLNRQGPDRGTQYRSAVFYQNDAQRRAAQSAVERLTRAGTYGRRIVTEITALDRFYPAEDYHQDYMRHHPDQPYIVRNDAPKVTELQRAFPSLYRASWGG